MTVDPYVDPETGGGGVGKRIRGNTGTASQADSTCCDATREALGGQLRLGSVGEVVRAIGRSPASIVRMADPD